LRCPFGCRQAHRKRCSTERSVAYYTTVEGKAKKKMQNGKRVRSGVGRTTAQPETGTLELQAGIVRYAAMVASLIEGRPVSQAEMLRRLARALRQHSMARRRRMDYVVAQLRKHGP